MDVGDCFTRSFFTDLEFSIDVSVRQHEINIGLRMTVEQCAS